MSYKPQGLKSMLLNYLKDCGTITRKELHDWAKRKHYEPCTAQRRIREMANEVGVIPLNDEGKKADIRLSEHIVAYRWKPTTMFNKKVC